MTARQRILEAVLLEKARKTPKLAEEMGIKIEYPANLDNRINKADSKLIHKNDQLLK